MKPFVHIDKSLLSFYAKWFSLPVLIIRIYLVASIFQYPVFKYVEAPGDLITELYFLVLYSLFFIPIIDFPLLTTILGFRTKPASFRKIVRVIADAIEGCTIIGFIHFCLAIWLVVTAQIFRIKLPDG